MTEPLWTLLVFRYKRVSVFIAVVTESTPLIMFLSGFVLNFLEILIYKYLIILTRVFLIRR